MECTVVHSIPYITKVLVCVWNTGVFVQVVKFANLAFVESDFFYVRANIHYCTVCVILLPAVFPALVKSRLKHRCWIGERKIIQPSPCSLDGGWMTQQKREAKGDATCVGWFGFPRIQLTHIECRLKCLIICYRTLLISINHYCHVSTTTEKIKDQGGPGEKGTNIRSPSNA